MIEIDDLPTGRRLSYQGYSALPEVGSRIHAEYPDGRVQIDAKVIEIKETESGDVIYVDSTQ